MRIIMQQLSKGIELGVGLNLSNNSTLAKWREEGKHSWLERKSE